MSSGNVVKITDHLANMVASAESTHRVAIDELSIQSQTVIVSTVRLVESDNNESHESLIFGGCLNGSSWRYADEAQAIMGHQTIKRALAQLETDLSAQNRNHCA